MRLRGGLNSQFYVEWHSERFNILDSFRRPNLFGRDLRDANLSGSFLVRVNVHEARLHNTNFNWAQMERSNLRDVSANGAQFAYAHLEFADLTNARLRSVQFENAWLIETFFFRSDLKGSNFVYANLQGASFRNANLQGVLFQGHTNADQNFAQTNFEGANLTNAAFRNVDLRETLGLTQAQVNSAFGSSSTELPEGLRQPCHWLDWDGVHTYEVGERVNDPNDLFIAYWRGWIENNWGTWPVSPLFESYSEISSLGPLKCPPVQPT